MVRIREVGTEPWSFGFETPLSQLFTSLATTVNGIAPGWLIRGARFVAIVMVA